MAKPGLVAAPSAQLHIGHARRSPRVRCAGIREPRTVPDAPRRGHADGVAGGAAVKRRAAFEADVKLLLADAVQRAYLSASYVGSSMLAVDAITGASLAQRRQIQRSIVKRPRPRERRGDARLRPAAVAGVEDELVLDVLARQ